MANHAQLINHQVRLAARPVGLPTRADWSFTSEPVAGPGPGGVLVKTLALSLDPAMRGWMNEGKSYIAPVGLGEVMRAGGIGVVVDSKNDAFATASVPTLGFRNTASSRRAISSAAACSRSTRAWVRQINGSTCWGCPA
jgi:NADPH-dependent curcumin reductase CurA